MGRYDDYGRELLEKAQKIAERALIVFFEKMGLDSKLCDEVNSIIPVIDEAYMISGTKGQSHYEAAADRIVVDRDYLDRMVGEVLDGPEDAKEKMERIVIYNIATSIVHERIHALRRIRTPKNIIPVDNYQSMISDDFDESYDYVVPCDVILSDHSSVTNQSELLTILQQQDSLEEAVTEALSQVIIYNAVPKFSDFSIKQLIDKVMTDDNDFVVAGAKIARIMDNDMLERFITTRYGETPYKDLFYEKFGDDYYILLSDIDEISKAAMDGDFPPKVILEEFDKILEAHKVKENKKI